MDEVGCLKTPHLQDPEVALFFELYVTRLQPGLIDPGDDLVLIDIAEVGKRVEAVRGAKQHERMMRRLNRK